MGMAGTCKQEGGVRGGGPPAAVLMCMGGGRATSLHAPKPRPRATSMPAGGVVPPPPDPPLLLACARHSHSHTPPMCALQPPSCNFHSKLMPAAIAARLSTLICDARLLLQFCGACERVQMPPPCKRASVVVRDRHNFFPHGGRHIKRLAENCSVSRPATAAVFFAAKTCLTTSPTRRFSPLRCTPVHDWHEDFFGISSGPFGSDARRQSIAPAA